MINIYFNYNYILNFFFKFFNLKNICYNVLKFYGGVTSIGISVDWWNKNDNKYKIKFFEKSTIS